MATSAYQIIRRSLLDIGVLAGGEEPTPEIAADSMDMLNDLLGSWSLEEYMIFNTTEIIFTTPPNKLEYTLGWGGSINCQFVASVTDDVMTIMQVQSGSISQNMMLTSLITVLPNDLRIIEFLSGAGGNSPNTVGRYRLNQSLGLTPQTIEFVGYHQRPLAIDTAYVRVSYQLNNANNYGQFIDYPVTILTLSQYQAIGIKALPGPWVKYVYMNPNGNLATLNFFPNPGIGEVHLFTKTLFAQFESINDPIDLLDGYVMALRWNLAEQLMPMFGKANELQMAMVTKNAMRGKAMIKRLNMNPVPVMKMDEMLLNAKVADAGFVLHGGFY